MMNNEYLHVNVNRYNPIHRKNDRLYKISSAVFSLLLKLRKHSKGTVEPRYLELAYFELPLISK